MSIVRKMLDHIRKLFGYETKPTTQKLENILEKYAVVEAVPGTNEYPAFLVVTEKTSASNLTGEIAFHEVDLDTTPNIEYVNRTIELRESKTKEIGSSSPSPYTKDLITEYNRNLQELKGFEQYQKMRFSDGVVAGILLAIKTPVNAGRWFIKPAGSESQDKEIADFVWDCITEYQSITWTQIKQEAMLSCDFGYMIFEKVWENRKINGKTRTVLRKLAPRNPMDVVKWKFDKQGGPVAVVMNASDGSDEYGTRTKEVEIPIEKLLVITFNKEFGNIFGRPILRPMYKHWYYKEQLLKIDAIQKERHGIGIPVIKLPVNFTEADKVSAELLGRNLRTNERANVTLPFGWDLIFAELHGNPVNAIESVKLHDKAMRESVLAGFTDTESNTKEEDLGLFLKATRFIAEGICEAINLYLIPELVDYNFDNVEKYPKLTVRQIGEQGDLRVLSFALRNAIGAGVIRPDDELEAHTRELFDLPPADIATVRLVQTPQAGQAAAQAAQGPLPPGVKLPNSSPGGPTPPEDGTGSSKPVVNPVGMPRQTPLPAVGVGGKNVGVDKGQS